MPAEIGAFCTCRAAESRVSDGTTTEKPGYNLRRLCSAPLPDPAYSRRCVWTALGVVPDFIRARLPHKFGTDVGSVGRAANQRGSPETPGREDASATCAP